MKTIGELLFRSRTFIEQNKLEISRVDLEHLFAHLLGLKRVDIYLQYDRPLIEHEIEKLRDGFLRLKKNEPLQYIIGEVPFLDCSILCDKRVLIPRPETEELAEKIVSELSKLNLTGKSFLDLCSGSGCIGISVKKKFPDLKVILSDISKDALDLAKDNAIRNEVDVEFLQGDLFSSLGDKKIDFFVSNPPYISEDEYKTLSPSVKNFEPKLALVGGSSGLEFYEKIAKSLYNYLLPYGIGWLEIGCMQGEDVFKIFSESGKFIVNLEKDFSGKDRFLCLKNFSSLD